MQLGQAHTSNVRFAAMTLWSVVLLVTAAGCTEESAPTARVKPVSPEGAPLSVPTTTNTPDQPDFQGLAGAWAGADFVELYWEAGGDEIHPSELIRYNVYAGRKSGKQDFDRRIAQTKQGETRIRITGLEPGETLFFVVRALDHHGHEDDNTIELNATPNPVLYVNGGADPGGDGSTPEQACKDFSIVRDQTIDRIGVNVFVAQGEYVGHVFLFEGMMLYGGFDPTFRSRNLEENPTIIRPRGQSKLVIAPPSELGMFCGLDGFRLIGNPDTDAPERVGEVAVDATDCLIQLSNLEVRNFVSTGIELSSEDPEEPIEGSILRCRVVDNRGEGIRLEGYLDFVIAYTEIRGNANEGIEIRMQTFKDEKSKVEVEYCHVSENMSPGIDVRVRTDVEEPGGRARIDLSGCYVERNEDVGANIDIRFSDQDAVDFQARIEGNSFNGNQKEGLRCDLDAAGDLRIANNSFRSNTTGLVLQGATGVGICRVLNDSYVENSGHAIELRSPLPLWVRHSEFARNSGAAIHNPFSGGWVDVAGCTFESQQQPSLVSHAEYSLLDDSISARHEGPELRVRQGNTDAETVIDLGPPSTRDSDESRADLGPLGGPCGAEPGTYAKRVRPTEIVKAFPSPGGFIGAGLWELRFTEDELVSRNFAVLVNGQPVPADIAIDGEDVTIELQRTLRAGDDIKIRLRPHNKQLWQLDLPYTAATQVEGESITASLPAYGEIEFTSNTPQVAFRIDPKTPAFKAMISGSSADNSQQIKLEVSDAKGDFVPLTTDAAGWCTIDPATLGAEPQLRLSHANTSDIKDPVKFTLLLIPREARS